jgi:cytoskeletal protein CcmA (bactofilin family)
MSAERTILGPTLEIEGEIEGDEDLVIQGKVSGRIVSKKSLTIDATGDVSATVTSAQLIVSGKLTGDVQASDRVEITKDGTVTGDVKAPRVVIADGARFKGRVEMGE